MYQNICPEAQTHKSPYYPSRCSVCGMCPASCAHTVWPVSFQTYRGTHTPSCFSMRSASTLCFHSTACFSCWNPRGKRRKPVAMNILLPVCCITVGSDRYASDMVFCDLLFYFFVFPHVQLIQQVSSPVLLTPLNKLFPTDVAADTKHVKMSTYCATLVFFFLLLFPLCILQRWLSAKISVENGLVM